MYDVVPDGDFRILETYTRALRSARELIYLENQFLWSSEIAEILQGKLEHPPVDDFRLVLVLPASPNDGADDTRGQLADLVDCDGGDGRLLACSLYALGERGPQQVYVHSKIGIVDDRWLTLGSANLNEHSLFNDTEVNVVTCDAELARDTRLRLSSEHLQRPASELAGRPVQVVDEVWKPIAEEQARRRDAGAPPTHRLCLLPGSRAAGAACSGRSTACSWTGSFRNSSQRATCLQWLLAGSYLQTSPRRSTALRLRVTASPPCRPTVRPSGSGGSTTRAAAAGAPRGSTR